MATRMDRRRFLGRGLAGLAGGIGASPLLAAARSPYQPRNDPDPSAFVMARLRYVTLTNVVGKWDVEPSGDRNLLAYLRKATNLKISNLQWKDRVVDVSDAATMYTLPFIFMTGEGNFILSPAETKAIGEFFKRGGFLYADECVMQPTGDFFYKAFLRELPRCLPGSKMRPVPSSHEIYRCFYKIPGGRSTYVQGKVHPDMGLFHKGRLVCYLTANDVHCGWWGGYVFGAKQQPALHMGTNIVTYALTH